MVKSLEQARDIQAHRVANGKRGYAKAVRRFLKREHGHEYRKEQGKLPVNWVKPKPKPKPKKKQVIEEAIENAA